MVHNEPMQIKEWLNSLPGSPTVSQAADKAGVSKATFLRHEKKGETTAEYAIAISRAYDVNEVQSLIDLAFVDAIAVSGMGIDQALAQATNSQILAELDRRVDPEARRVFRGEGQDNVVDLAGDADVVDFPTPVSTPTDDDEDAIAEANQFLGAAQKRTPRLDEPENP